MSNLRKTASALALGTALAMSGGYAASAAVCCGRVRGGRPGGGMAGNPAAILSPKPPVEASASGRINAAGFLDSIRRYENMDRAKGNIWLTPKGLFALSAKKTDAERRRKALTALGWPSSIAEVIDDTSLSRNPIASSAAKIYQIARSTAQQSAATIKNRTTTRTRAVRRRA